MDIEFDEIDDGYFVPEVCKPGRHVWIGGMCYVDNEDAQALAEGRLKAGIQSVTCETCGKTYKPGDEWED